MQSGNIIISIAEKVFSFFSSTHKLYDYQLSPDTLIKKLESENIDATEKTSAQCILGLCYLYGLNDAVINFEKGIELLLEAAKNLKTPGGLCAQGIICLCNQADKLSDEHDPVAEAKEYFLRAKSYEYIPAMYELAKLLYNEYKQTITHQQANTCQMIHEHCLELLNKCVDKRYALAEDLLATCYVEGTLIKTNEHKAFNLYLRSAQSGCAIGKLHVAKYFALGEVIEQDNSEAFKWLESATNQNYKAAKIHFHKWLEGQSLAEYLRNYFIR